MFQARSQRRLKATWLVPWYPEWYLGQQVVRLPWTGRDVGGCDGRKTAVVPVVVPVVVSWRSLAERGLRLGTPWAARGQ